MKTHALEPPAAFRDLPLQRKMLVLVALAILVALLVGSGSVALYEVTTYRPRELVNTHAQAQSVAETVTSALELRDRDRATQFLNAFARQRNIRALGVLDVNGDVFAEYLRPGTPRVSFRPSPGSRGPRPRDAIVANEPVLLNGEVIGSVWLISDLRPFSARLLEYAALLAVGALSLLALAIMLSITIRRAISEPVQALVSAARNVTERRDYTLRVPTPRKDEVGQLAHEFNTMLATIEERDHALQRSEATTRRQLSEIEGIYASAEVGLCMIDRELRYVRINKKLAEMNGRSIDESLGRTVAEVVPDMADTLAPIFRKILATGEPILNAEVQGYVPSSRELRYWITSHHPLLARSGEVVGVNVVVLEVTDRKRAEQERANLEAQLRQSQKMQALGTLAGGIAHDFNNVLTAITGNARLALDDLPADHPALISLHEINRGAERAKDLVRRILAFSRQEQSDRHLIDLRPVVDEALRLLRATVPTMIDIRAEAAPNLPKVMADATQVHQVLMNLGTNACDAMKGRGGRLMVKLSSVITDTSVQKVSPDLQPGRYLRISVEDTGVGIDGELIERIFEPFFTTKPPGQGTGLGLSVVHGIMRGHQGAVLVRSEPGRGSVFDLYFPASDRSESERSAEAAIPSPSLGRGEHILYVDDEEPLVFLVTRMMQRMGYEVTGLTRADDAIEAVRADPQRFDLVISDLGMPGMSGMDLAHELLAIRPGLPVIITSGYVRPEDARRAEDIGVRDIVLKPGTVAEMGQLIRERLNELHRSRD
jgi:PAS domain S-box-containing protein